MSDTNIIEIVSAERRDPDRPAQGYTVTTPEGMTLTLAGYSAFHACRYFPPPENIRFGVAVLEGDDWAEYEPAWIFPDGKVYRGKPERFDGSAYALNVIAMGEYPNEKGIREVLFFADNGVVYGSYAVDATACHVGWVSGAAPSRALRVRRYGRKLAMSWLDASVGPKKV